MMLVSVRAASRTSPAARAGIVPPCLPVYLVERTVPVAAGARAAARGLVLAVTLCAALNARASTYYVDRGNSGCSDSGPGTSSTPYCTITAALAAHHGSGTTILVKPGTYREQVTIPGSGASGSPLEIEADGSAGQVIVEGADNYGSTSLWSSVGSSTYLAASVTWSPVQVFADGARLTATTASPSSMPAGTFRWVSGTGLYVNLGGGNPGGHGALVGHRLYGFYMDSKSWVTIEGFAIRHAESRGIRITQSNNVVALSNQVSASGGFGILAEASTSIQIRGNTTSDNANHGIGLTSASSGCTVDGNESFGNAVPGIRAANGIYLYGATSNVIKNNRLHDNQDTGMQFQPGANDNLSLQNRSWNNGDHGYDHLQASGNVHIGDVAWGNHKDGFSIEGSSPNQKLYDCIAVNNGLTTNEYDLWVDGTSTSGFQSNDNLFWNSSSQPPVKYVSTVYATVGAYSTASGQDSRTIQADPKFTSPSQGDFHLSSGSPAIDNANSSVSGWPSTDANGAARVDVASVPNTGMGPVTYADRGALEYGAGNGADVPVASHIEAAPARVTPNPTRPAGRLVFSTTRSGSLAVEILDVSGRRVRTVCALADCPAGDHALALDGRRDDGRPLEAGVYWFAIRSVDGLTRGRFVVMH